MARKTNLSKAAERIGGAFGRAEVTAHRVAKAGVVAKEELDAISKQIDALKKQLAKTTKKIKKALG